MEYVEARSYFSQPLNTGNGIEKNVVKTALFLLCIHMLQPRLPLRPKQGPPAPQSLRLRRGSKVSEVVCIDNGVGNIVSEGKA